MWITVCIQLRMYVYNDFNYYNYYRDIIVYRDKLSTNYRDKKIFIIAQA